MSGEEIFGFVFMGSVFMLANILTWQWKYRHMDYPNGFPSKIGLAGTQELIMGLFLSVLFTYWCVVIFREGQKEKSILWLILPSVSWIIQLVIITRKRISWEEFYKLQDEQLPPK